MRSTIVSYGDPVWFKTTAMYADLGKFYGLPSWGTAGSSDSFEVDAQAALEALGAEPLADLGIQDMSRGQARLAFIARALAARKRQVDYWIYSITGINIYLYLAYAWDIR